MNPTKNLRQLLLFFGMTLGLTYLVFWGPLVLFKIPGASFAGPSGPPWAVALFISGGFTPSIVAILLNWKQKTLREMWKRLNPFTVNLKWHAIILGIVVLASAGQMGILHLMDQAFDHSLFLTQGMLLLPLLILGPLSEELGWRGYALPRLLSRWNPLTSSLILGVVWSFWHLPLFYLVGTAQYVHKLSFLAFMVGTTTVSFLYTWMFNNTNGSIWSAVFFHWAYTYVMDTINVGSGSPTAVFQWVQYIPYLVITILVIFRSFPKNEL
jgi:membrane protease YdiL (CAAX protease family)